MTELVDDGVVTLDLEQPGEGSFRLGPFGGLSLGRAVCCRHLSPVMSRLTPLCRVPATAGAAAPRGGAAAHRARAERSAPTRASSATASASSHENQATWGLSPGAGSGSSS